MWQEACGICTCWRPPGWSQAPDGHVFQKSSSLIFIGIPMMMYYSCLETTRTVVRELYLSSGGNITDWWLQIWNLKPSYTKHHVAELGSSLSFPCIQGSGQRALFLEGQWLHQPSRLKEIKSAQPVLSNRSQNARDRFKKLFRYQEPCACSGEGKFAICFP